MFEALSACWADSREVKTRSRRDSSSLGLVQFSTQLPLSADSSLRPLKLRQLVRRATRASSSLLRRPPSAPHPPVASPAMDPNLTYKQQPELTIQLSLQQPTSSSSPTPPRPTALPTLPNASSSTKSPSVAQQLAERRMALGRKRGAEEVGEGERGASRVKVEGGRTLEGDESAGDLPGQPVASGSGSRAGTRGLGGLHSMLRGSWGGFASGSRGMVSGSSGAVPAVVPLGEFCSALPSEEVSRLLLIS